MCAVAPMRQTEINGSAQMGERALEEERRGGGERRAGQESRGDDERGG